MDQATLRQLRASQPDVSTWLSANAGSGKTKVLTDRVARLLLSGTRPEHILCLTYTKAAASEMQNRLFQRLGEWAMKPDSDLRAELEKLAPDTELNSDALNHARTLFATAVETPGGLKIQTIHSFCAALLRRFPLEAGVSPQFKEMDYVKSQEILAEIIETLTENEGRDALDSVADYISDLDATALASELAKHRHAFAKPYQRDDIAQWFGCDVTEESLLKAVFLGDEKNTLHEAAELMAASGKTDAKNALLFRKWAQSDPSLDLLEELCAKLIFDEKSKTAPFMSKFNAQNGSIPSRALLKSHPDAFVKLEQLMGRVEQNRQKMHALFDTNRTYALHRFAQSVLSTYQARKDQLGLLDFDDMIRSARDLLSNSSVADWVLFRLDGGIDHILVDEAQDTSPDQWKVIEALSGEFTYGEGARPDVERTIFVVGDQKQSIYSFQGAAPDAYEKMKAHFSDKLSEIERPLQDLAMEHSFRSSPAILNFTDSVYEASQYKGLGKDAHHIAFFEDMPGRVDLWPLVQPSDAETSHDDKNWDDPVDKVAEEHINVQLSNQLSNYIADLLENGSIPAKDGGFRKIEPRDIMILVRNRTGLFMPLLNALKSHPAGIPVAGADRLKLNEELAVKDLKSLLAFLSLPDDDLALAECLKSPLFGWSEAQLFDLAHKRTSVTLWREFYERREEWPEDYAILNDLRDRSDFLRPYDLLERILIDHKGRENLLGRLGKEAEDGIDALLFQAQNYEQSETPSLTGFLAWLDIQDVEIKRVLDEGSNLIRVMTAHGSKGLEAPIVILPDTVKPVPPHRDSLLTLEGDKVIWKAQKARQSDVTAAHLETLKEAATEEDRRLLYVAMTRAEKWLIIAGAGQAKDDTWYDLAANGLERLPTSSETNGVLRYQHGEWGVAKSETQSDNTETETAPNWSPAPDPDRKDQMISPTELAAKAKSHITGGDVSAEAALRRGRQMHLLLEVLSPDAQDLHTHIRAILAHGEDAVLEEELEGLAHETRQVLSTSYDWPVFDPAALTEVPYISKLSDQTIHGIIDRVLITDTHIRIVDFKTNRDVPKTPEDVSNGYLIQLAAYADVCAKLYPTHKIEIALLWTANATLMPIPLERAQAALKDVMP